MSHRSPTDFSIPGDSSRDLFYPPHPLPESSYTPSRQTLDELELRANPWQAGEQLAQPVIRYEPVEETPNLIRRYFSAYEAHDRETVERLMSPDFSFSSSLKNRLDREAYFRECWPISANVRIHIQRIIEKGREAFVSYECERPDGSRFQNTAFFILREDSIRHIHIYGGSSQISSPPRATPEPETAAMPA